VLKTDDNFIVGTLTASRAVVTDGSNQLSSSATTATEIGYVSGVTSAIQTQIDGKVSKSGDTMTGALILPAGSAAAPSLRFTGSTNTGLSAATANTLSFDTNGAERMKIDGSGNVTINGFGTAGVIHNDSSGLLSSSLIVNADITNATIANAKLATISSADIPGNIVVRDGSGNFATNMITIDGAVVNPTDVATKAYVDSVTSSVTCANVGAGTCLIFRDKTGNNINFKSLIQGSHIVITNNANDITLATDGTNLNTASTIVARDGTGNFSASIISMTDGVLSGDLRLVNSTSTTGNIEKAGSSFIHNFGTNNTFVGVNAGNYTTSGTGRNSAFGTSALTLITTGSNNIAIGYQAGQTLTTGSGNIYINAAAGAINETDTTRIGTSQTRPSRRHPNRLPGEVTMTYRGQREEQGDRRL
jgi:hypothetical protein